MFVRMIVVTIATLFSFSSSAGELEARQAVYEQVRQLLSEIYLTDDGSVAELEAMAEAFRSQESRTSSGLWNLRLFYVGINRTNNFETGDAEYFRSVEAFWESYKAEIPDSPIPIIGLAYFYWGLAWHYRGDRYVSDVPPLDWRRFIINMEKAEAILRDGQSVGKNDPEWYVVMLSVLGVNRSNSAEFNLVLWEGMQKYPEYHEIYFSAATYLEKRWSGNDGLLDFFARYAVSHTAYEQGAGIYTRIYWYMAPYYGSWFFSRTNVDWELMKLGMLDILEEYPDEWNIQNFASFACTKNDAGMTEWLIAQMNEAPITGVWKYRTFEECRDDVAPQPLGDRSWPDDYRMFMSGFL